MHDEGFWKTGLESRGPGFDDVVRAARESAEGDVSKQVPGKGWEWQGGSEGPPALPPDRRSCLDMGNGGRYRRHEGYVARHHRFLDFMRWARLEWGHIATRAGRGAERSQRRGVRELRVA